MKKILTLLGAFLLAATVAVSTAPMAVFADDDDDAHGWINGTGAYYATQGDSFEVTIDIVSEHDVQTSWHIEDGDYIASISGHDDDSASIYANYPGDCKLVIDLQLKSNGRILDTKYIAIHVAPSAGYYVPVRGVGISMNQAAVYVGTYTPLTAWCYPANASNPEIDWDTSNDADAAIRGDGVIFAKAPGEAYITARSADSGDVAICHVVVVPIQ